MAFGCAAVPFLAFPEVVVTPGGQWRTEAAEDADGDGACTSMALYTGLARVCEGGLTRGGVVVASSL